MHERIDVDREMVEMIYLCVYICRERESYIELPLCFSRGSEIFLYVRNVAMGSKFQVPLAPAKKII